MKKFTKYVKKAKEMGALHALIIKSSDIIIDPSEHKGMPHRRYHGKTGQILKKQGKAFIVGIKQGNATKQIIANKEHLRLSRSVIQTSK